MRIKSHILLRKIYFDSEQNKEYNFSIVSFILSVLGLVSSILTIITFYQSL